MAKRAAQGDLYYPGKTKKSVQVRTAGGQAITISRPIMSGFGSGTNAQAIRTGGWANPTRSGELKFTDVSYNTDPAVNSAAFTAGGLLNGLVPGASANERIGRKVTLKSILIRWSFHMTPTSAGTGALRILVVYDKQANAAAPAITDILLTDDFHSQNNLSNRDRFVTIFDTITDAIGTAGPQTVSGVNYKRLNFETLFNAGPAGTIGDISSGSVYIFIAQSGYIITNAADFTARCRIRYTDV